MKRPPDDHTVLVDARGPGEWIVRAPSGGRALHVYRVAPSDWLVSEVGRGNEGRGADLGRALAALSAVESAVAWWDAVPAALDGEQQQGG